MQIVRHVFSSSDSGIPLNYLRKSTGSNQIYRLFMTSMFQRKAILKDTRGSIPEKGHSNAVNVIRFSQMKVNMQGFWENTNGEKLHQYSLYGMAISVNSYILLKMEKIRWRKSISLQSI